VATTPVPSPKAPRNESESVSRIGRNRCPYCHRSAHIYVSRYKSLREVAAIALLLRPVRCHDCFLRFFRSLFIKAPRPPSRA
jgi:predicted Zn-ribbon and HTH transcriptional regulator